ncbi:MAG TPA: prepilin-type N-terminal cleavage/methylation domain-containing protein [Roseimicrobium sp.]|nr:prepilin-type N-terminal cleavage/methylation domain-containing protein [Roseimicrobium sp.]
MHTKRHSLPSLNSAHRGLFSHKSRGMTLVELAISSTLLTIGMVAIFGSLIYSRRLSEGSIYQNAAVTVVQGYIEQMKNMEFADLPYITSAGAVVAGSGTTSTEIATRLNATTADPLVISTATTIPALSTITVTASSALAGVTDNLKNIDINNTPTKSSDDLRLNVRVWVQDITNTGISATQVRSITIQYAWQGGIGSNSRIYRSSVRTIRSAVPTY